MGVYNVIIVLITQVTAKWDQLRTKAEGSANCWKNKGNRIYLLRSTVKREKEKGRKKAEQPGKKQSHALESLGNRGHKGSAVLGAKRGQQNQPKPKQTEVTGKDSWGWGKLTPSQEQAG